MENGAATMENSLVFAHVEIPYDPTILLLGIYPEELKMGIQTNTCT